MSLKIVSVQYGEVGNHSWNSLLRYKHVLFTLTAEEILAGGTIYHDGRPGPNLAVNAFLASKPFDGYLARRYTDPVESFPLPYSWADWGFNPNYYKIVSESDSVYPDILRTRILKYLEVRNSSNTVDWPGPKGTRVGGLILTKNKPPTNRPKEPVYHTPKLLQVREPLRHAPVSLRMNPPNPGRGEGGTSYQIRYDRWSSKKSRREAKLTLAADRKYFQQLSKYKLKLSTNAVRIARSRELFKKAQANYAKRLANYNRLVALSKDMTYKRAPIHPSDIPVDNPYGYIKMAFREIPRYQTYDGGFLYNTVNNLSVMDYYNWTPEEKNALILQDFVLYKSKLLTDRSSPTELAQYAENTRNLILSIVDPFLVEHDEKLRRKIHQKLKNQTVHIGNIIAERKQTMDLVQSSVKRILQLIKLKKNIFKTAATYAKNAKQIASDILAFKFGVEPLLNDIQSFAKYLDDGTDTPIVTVRANVGGKKPLYIKIETSAFSFTGFVEISYVVKCVVENPATRALSEFGLINPLEILWEVTPWSFVIDWFLPVGDWISNKTADCGLAFKTGTRKVRLVGTFVTHELSGLQPEASGDPVTGFSPNALFVDFDGEVVGRSVLTDLPGLPPVRLKNPLSWSHGIESVALAVQKLKIR